MIRAKNQEDMLAINIVPPSASRENAIVRAFKINYCPRFSEREIEFVAMVESVPQQGLRVQKILVKNRMAQADPKIIRELTGYRWAAVPVGEETMELPNVSHLWEFPDLYLAACEPKTASTPLARQIEQIREKELLLFYTLKEWWKKNKHLGFEGALAEYKNYLQDYYARLKELREAGKKTIVRMADVEAMKNLMAARSLPENEPQSWQKAGKEMKALNGALWEEFPPLGPVGVIEQELSAYISLHSYNVNSGSITYISVLVESGDNVINQYLVWNTGTNDMIEDMNAIREKLLEYGITKRQFNYELMPMFGAR